MLRIQKTEKRSEGSIGEVKVEDRPKKRTGNSEMIINVATI